MKLIDFQASFPLADALGVNTPVYFTPREDSQGEQGLIKFDGNVLAISPLLQNGFQNDD
jgi:hypothetical protein